MAFKEADRKPTGNEELKRSTAHQNRFKSQAVEYTVYANYDEIVGAVFVSTTGTEEAFPLDPSRYSSWLHLKRILTWIFRFIHNCQRTKRERTRGELSSDEIKSAEIQLIKQEQRTHFKEEWTALSRGQSLPASSKIVGLQPKLDDDGLMRSDGRLKYADFPSFDVRFPNILPRKGWLTKLMVKNYREKENHASGTNHTLTALSARFWIISGREVIRRWEKDCMECRRRKAKAARQIVAPLPLSRLMASTRAFTRIAVDFGGPYITVQGRGKRREKRNLCLFTCMATRAVHLEIAFGLDTAAFLNAFYRMASRRGVPEEMYSDNGTNFKGADNELRLLVAQLNNEKVNNKGVRWHFNPPFAPHFCGVHETMIKSAKRAIHAILGNADVNDEELMTAIIGAEALINSRPLTYQSADPSDDAPLTPNHFLHGQIGGQFAPASVDKTDFNPRKRWRRIQELVRHFSNRWLKEWLPRLSARTKWSQPVRDFKVSDVVLVITSGTIRGNWSLGRVLETYLGKDGWVRVAKIQVGQGTLTIRTIRTSCL